MIAASPVACVSSFKFLTMQIYPSGSLARNCGPFYPRPPCSQTSRSASAGELSRSDLVLWHLADNPTASAFVRYWTKADKGRFWPTMVCPLLTHQRHQGPHQMGLVA